MIEKWLISTVVGFVLRQLSKFAKTVKWDMIKADVAVRVAALVPGEFFDPEAVSMVNSLLDACARVLAATPDLEKVLNLLAASDWNGAWLVLKDLLLKAWGTTPPANKAEAKVYAFLQKPEADSLLAA